jgi:hypothetical protein
MSRVADTRAVMTLLAFHTDDVLGGVNKSVDQIAAASNKDLTKWWKETKASREQKFKDLPDNLKDMVPSGVQWTKVHQECISINFNIEH